MGLRGSSEGDMQRSLEEAQIHEEVQWVTQRSLEEACAQKELQHDA
jgi:hypothetical protein